jgi:hypothetical protein
MLMAVAMAFSGTVSGVDLSVRLMIGLPYSRLVLYAPLQTRHYRDRFAHADDREVSGDLGAQPRFLANFAVY